MDDLQYSPYQAHHNNQNTKKDIIITTDLNTNSHEKLDDDEENITKGIRFRKKVQKTKSH